MRHFPIALRTLVIAAFLAGISAPLASASSAALPRVTGSFDHAPHVTFPNSKPPSNLVVKVLHQGNGVTVHKKDLIVVNYLGQIWRGKVFDSSYSRQLFGIPIGVGQVIPAWDDGLVGKKVGSRVLLVAPPKDAYGPKGNSQVGISGNSTLTFVVDIVADYTSKVHGDLHATTLRTSVGGVTVKGAMNKNPSILVAKGASQPKTPSVTLLSKGHGPKIKPGLIVLQTVVSNWSGVTQASTWTLGSPDAELVGQKSSPSLLDKMVGKPVGSRFVALIPKSGTSGPYVVVLVVAAQPHGEASQPS